MENKEIRNNPQLELNFDNNSRENSTSQSLVEITMQCFSNRHITSDSNEAKIIQLNNRSEIYKKILQR